MSHGTDVDPVEAAVEERTAATLELPFEELLDLGYVALHEEPERRTRMRPPHEIIDAVFAEIRTAALRAHAFERDLAAYTSRIQPDDPLRPLYRALEELREQCDAHPSAPYVPGDYIAGIVEHADGFDLDVTGALAHLRLEILPSGDGYVCRCLTPKLDPLEHDLAGQLYLDLLACDSHDARTLRNTLERHLGTEPWKHRLDQIDAFIGSVAAPEDSESATAEKAQLRWGLSVTEKNRPIAPMLSTRGRSGRWLRPKRKKPDAIEWRQVEHRLTDRWIAGRLDDVRGSYQAGRVHSECFERLIGSNALVAQDDPATPARLLAYSPTVRVEADDEGFVLHIELAGKPLSLLDVIGRAVSEDGCALSFLAGVGIAWHEPRAMDPNWRTLLDVRDLYANAFLWVDWSAPHLSLLHALGPSGQRYPKHTFARIRRALDRAGELLPVEWTATTDTGKQTALSRAIVIASPSVTPGAIAVRVLIEPHPGTGLFQPGEGSRTVPGLAGDGLLLVERDFGRENERVARLRAILGDDAHDTMGEFHRFELRGAEALLPLIAFAESDGDFELRWESLEPLKVAKVGQVSLRTSSRLNWFDIDGEAAVDGKTVTLRALLRTVRQNRRFVKLDADRFAEIDQELYERLQQLEAAAERAKDEDEQLTVSREGLLSIADTLEAVGTLHADEELERFRAELDALREWTPEVAPSFSGTLRPYQREGFEWLARMGRLGLGCVLADDMGLGKTVQALAYLASRNAAGPVLVVAPTSVCDNWARECQRFDSQLTPAAYRGSGRVRALEALAPDSVVITSYALLYRDREALAAVEWDVVLFDEAQYLKNPNAKTTRAALALNARHRVALTGTPLENHLGELWSLFRVLVPGLLGPFKRFNERFAKPVQAGVRAASAQLASLIRPYILRRDKATVAHDLPPLEEIVIDIDLDRRSRERYEEIRAHAELHLTADRNEARNALGLEKRRFEVLSALTRLRQAACSLALLGDGDAHRSPKLERAVEMLEVLMGEGRRVLVFSQFVKFLNLLRDRLDEQGLASLTLDGSTPGPTRQARIDAFQAGECPLFLISLKAGGTGLNLTAADTVIHLDPWWNPAVEQQATDRVHRIGQDKPVTVYKLVARDTVEDKILVLQQQKRALINDTIGGAASSSSLSVDDMVALLRDPERSV